MRTTSFKNLIMRGNLVFKAATTRDCPQCTMSIPVAARRCPECTAQIIPATELSQPVG